MTRVHLLRYRAIDAHDEAVLRAHEESGADEHIEDRRTLRGIEAGQPAELRFGETKAGHFAKFTLHTVREIAERLRRRRRRGVHELTPFTLTTDREGLDQCRPQGVRFV